MPFKSAAQRRKFAQLLVEGKISDQTFEEWNRETRSKGLPEHVKKKAKSSGTTASKRNHNGAKKNRALATYEVWGRVAGRLRRLQFGLSSQIEARRVRRELTEQGHSDLVTSNDRHVMVGSRVSRIAD